MQNIIHHKNTPAITSFPTNLTEGSINPLRRISYNQIVNINSRFRDDYYITPSTDFFLTIPGIPNKVTSMKLAKINLPNFVYTVNRKTGSDNFYIKVTTSHDVYYKRIVIPSGSYNANDIVSKINEQLNNFLETTEAFFHQGPFGSPPRPYKLSVLINIISQYNPNNGKISFVIEWKTHHHILNIKEVTFCFDYVEPCKGTIDCSGIAAEDFCENDKVFSQKPNSFYEDQMTLGWLLGFRGDYRYRSPKWATPDPLNSNFLTTNTKALSRKELKNLSSIKPRRARITEIKDNGQQYLEPRYHPIYNCCDISGGQLFESSDISFCYNITNPDNTTLPSYSRLPAESIYDPIGNRYFLLSVNDFQNNHTRSLISPMQNEALLNSHILGKINDPCHDCCFDGNPRIYFGPTSINRLHIKLLDEFGRIIDLNNADFSFSLELEILYDL